MTKNTLKYACVRIDDHIRMCRLIRAVVKIDTIVRITLQLLKNTTSKKMSY